MSDDTQPVCNDAEFKSIAEMPVDIHLLDCGVGSGMGRHGAVGGFIGVKGIIQTIGFFKGFELFDNTVSIFGIVFLKYSQNYGISVALTLFRMLLNLPASNRISCRTTIYVRSPC